MKLPSMTAPVAMTLSSIALASTLLTPLSVHAGRIALATEPLANTSTTTVLPNLMFILDASGSMDWNYLPDWVDDSLCRNPDTIGNTNPSYNYSCVNSPFFKSPDVNGVYYNPNIRYVPPVDGLGNSFASQTTWTNVKDDAYGRQSTSSTNLVTGYGDIEWCTDAQDRRGNYTYADCLRNNNYILPGNVTVNGTSNAYIIPRTTTASGTVNVVRGTPAIPIVEQRAIGPHYYRINPGEWCDSDRLTNCQWTSGGEFTFPAPIRWCNNATNARAANPAAGTCQGLRRSGFTVARMPTRFFAPVQNYVPPVAASAQINFNVSRCANAGDAVKVTSILANGTNILNGETASARSASGIVTAILNRGANSGYTFAAVSNTSRLLVTAPYSAGANVSIVINWENVNSGCTTRTPSAPTTNALTGYVQEVQASPETHTGSFVRTDIVPGRTQYPRASTRTDCITSTTYCSYTEEMTNFANWWTYYQTRMQTMKTAASLAFKDIDNRYRVGFIDIYGTSNRYLPINTFSAGTDGVKDRWYKMLFSINPSGGTPLRSALARVGRIYAGQVGSSDPMQYSCQQNFALLTTDGYWNGDTGNNAVPDLQGVSIGNMDGGNTARPMYEGPTASSNSLADVAKYYYDTDLRTEALGNCEGAIAGVSVCENNVFVSGTDNNRQQHMTTFTLGLGVDGRMLYRSDYKTAGSGDYYDIVHGTGNTPNWSVPANDSETAIDDLWHAAVNGRGTYFSAKDPRQLSDGLNDALASISSRLGAGSAAATSSLNPVANDNFAYVASYTTVKWQGNLERRTINLDNGVVSEAADWCVENKIDTPCAAPGSITSTVVDGSTAYFCSTPDSTADTCRGTLDASNICHVALPVACTGTMAAKVAASSDTRVIKMAAADGTLTNFTYANLSVAQKAAFSSSTLNQLNQWADFSDAQKTLAVGANLVNYLRGQTGFEMRRTGNAAENQLYRYREATLGDVIESQPSFVGKPQYRYADAGYSAFIEHNSARGKTVYVGANDGMLHAINADNGRERWAFVPTAVIPRLWRLADKNYDRMHTNYVNGRTVVADVYDATNERWRTILVAGLGGGGRAYYALDITDPDAPSLLWEIDSSAENNLGYSYGHPIVTKKADGTWVVLFTSGYNNFNPGDGQGYLFVRNALTGASIATIGTGAGDSTTPSGLAKIASYKDDLVRNNTSVAVYGGDVLGNLWRFDINAAKAADAVMKFATLTDATGAAQPITSAPELGVAYGKRLVFIGTGKYLEISDLELENAQTQTLYAFKDDNQVETITDPRAVLVEQTLTKSDDGSTRKASQNEVDFRNDGGWFIDLPDVGERIHLEPLLDAGLLIVPSTVPSSTICSPGGYGWLNYFNYLNGHNDDGIVSELFDATIVGTNVFYTPNGERHVSVVTSDDPTPRKPTHELPNPENLKPFKGKRVIWREMIQP